MVFVNACVLQKKQILDDTYIFLLRSEKSFITFSPGQYVYLRNPAYLPATSHPFSIASSPLQKTYLEFCIKVYGQWTKQMSLLDKGSIVGVSSARGKFIWDNSISHAVFLLGGIGISPIMSIFRYLCAHTIKPKSITLLYGNRTPETIAYKNELHMLVRKLHLKQIDIFSHISKSHPWKGYRGFITKKIIQDEVNLAVSPTFFIVGPPVFMQKMLAILSQLGVSSYYIKREVL